MGAKGRSERKEDKMNRKYEAIEEKQGDDYA